MQANTLLLKATRDSRANESPDELVIVDPLECPDWDALLATHAQSTFFHGTAWAQVLHATYGHRPVYFSRIVQGRLQELLPLMEVSSRWTGLRGVSLPFTDFCAALPTPDDRGRRLHESAMELGRQRRWRYLECRSSCDRWPGASPSAVFHGHRVELNRPPEQLLCNLDGAVRRGIRKAVDAGIQVEFSNNPESIRIFYGLHCLTRRRHGLPPQPWLFFENIASHVLTKRQGFVTTARYSGKALAAAVCFHRGRQAIFKFGASDHAFQHLRPNNLVMWEMIKRCAAEGFASLHLGRTSLTNQGLRRFKLGFGAQEERIEYCRYDFIRQAFVSSVDRAEGWFNGMFRWMPAPLLRLAGRILYPHLS